MQDALLDGGSTTRELNRNTAIFCQLTAMGVEQASALPVCLSLSLSLSPSLSLSFSLARARCPSSFLPPSRSFPFTVMAVAQAKRLEKNLSKFTADAYVKQLKRKYCEEDV